MREQDMSQIGLTRRPDPRTANGPHMRCRGQLSHYSKGGLATHVATSCSIWLSWLSRS